MDWTSIVTTVLSVIIGGLITAYFSRRYYVKASGDLTKEAEELKQETDKLRRLTIMLMRLLDQAGLIPIKWDEQGNPLMTASGTADLRWQVEAKEENIPADTGDEHG
jgi:hypothetical protein